jgi:hypothetical protein
MPQHQSLTSQPDRVATARAPISRLISQAPVLCTTSECLLDSFTVLQPTSRFAWQPPSGFQEASHCILLHCTTTVHVCSCKRQTSNMSAIAPEELAQLLYANISDGPSTHQDAFQRSSTFSFTILEKGTEMKRRWREATALYHYAQHYL